MSRRPSKGSAFVKYCGFMLFLYALIIALTFYTDTLEYIFSHFIHEL